MRKIIVISLLTLFSLNIYAQKRVKFDIYVIDFCLRFQDEEFKNEMKNIKKNHQCVLKYNRIEIRETIEDKVLKSIKNAKEITDQSYLKVEFYFIIKVRTGFLKHETLMFSTEGIYYYKGKYYMDKELLYAILPYIPDSLRCGFIQKKY